MTYRPRPNESDTIAIKINDVFGEAIFNKFQTKSITNTDEFKDYFKGIKLQPGENNGSVIGFSTDNDACIIRLFYSVPEQTGNKQSYIDLKISKSSGHPTFFNQITAENPNEYLQLLTDQEESISSLISENQTFLQSGIGITTLIKFPNVKSLYDISGKGTVLEATLKIRPFLNTYNDYLSLKDTLNLYLVAKNNIISSKLTYSDGSALQAILNKKDLEFNEVYYNAPIGSYIEALLTNKTNIPQTIALLPNNYESSVDRMILNGFDSTNNSTQLQLIYTVYDNEN